MMRTLQTRDQAKCLKTLRTVGYRWTIENMVDHNLELHNVIVYGGKEHVLFVAELDSYGNVKFE